MEWKEVRLGEICDLIAGYAFKARNFGDYPTKVIRIGDINPPFVNYDSEVGVDLQPYDIIRLQRYVVSYGDFVLAMTGATIGKIGKYINEIPSYLNQRVLKFCPKDNFDKEFVYYLVNSYNFAQYVNNHIDSESAQPNISARTIAKYEIKIPTKKSDQIRIASILSSLDSKIETNNKINAKLEEMAQALFKSWFVDFEPFKDGEFEESELGRIPKGWRVGSPYEFVDVIYGAPYKSKLFNENKEGLPIIRIRDLKTCSPQFYSPEILPNTEYVEAGEILAGMDAEFIPYIWKGDKGLLNQRVCKIKPKSDKICKLFGMYLMKPQLEFVQSYKTGTTVSHLGKGDIDRFEVIIPPLSIVEDFSVISKAILEEMVTLAKESSRLTHLRDTLLPKLMNGEIEL